MSYVVKLNEEQLSFLFNNMEGDSMWIDSYKNHAWYKMMDVLCWDAVNDKFKPENPLILLKEQRDVMYQDLVADSEMILKQLGMDVRYHTCNDSSFMNSKWCLEMISDVLQAIKDAEEM